MIGIDMDFLKKLGIEADNFGASTGLDWVKTTDQGTLKISYPADGKHNENVYQCSEAD